MIHENKIHLERYRERALSYQDIPSWQISCWGTQACQEENFIRIKKFLDGKSYDSFLDVGSGLGSIRKFLKEDVDYLGVDTCKEVVERAGDPKIIYRDILKDKLTKKFDVVACVGSFNMGVPFSLVLKYLKEMESLCSRYLIFSVSYLEDNEVEVLVSLGFVIVERRVYSGDDLLLVKSYPPPLN